MFGGEHAIPAPALDQIQASAPEYLAMGGREKLAIVGFWEGNRAHAPFADESYCVYGLNHLHPYIARWDVWMDIHPPEWSAQHLKAEVWADQDRWLRLRHGRPIYMQRPYAEYPESREFPLEAIVKRFGRRYFTNAIAYMIAHALLEHVAGRQRIARLEVWGADMRHEEEYAIQRPCAEFWLGVAQGLGIDVFIPSSAGLLHNEKLYGYEDQSGMVAEALRAHTEILRAAREKREKALAELYSLDGFISDNEEWLRRWEQRSRGGRL